MMQRSTTLVSVLALAVAVATGLGCSISQSLETISDSVSSPFKSSSGSSGGDSAAYREDVSELTVAALATPGSVAGFRRDVARLAEERGVTDWEGDALTLAGIGDGLRTAGIVDADVEATVNALVGSEASVARSIHDAYRLAAH